MTPHRIDTHHHILPPDYISLVGEKRIGGPMLTGGMPQWSPQLSLDAMDRNGIATAITSISAPGLWFGDQALTTRLSRYCNEYAVDLRRLHPARFGVFACLPLPDVEASLSEIVYSMDVLKADGIGLFTSYGERYPGDAAFAPVFDELNRRKAVVYFHPVAGTCSTCLGHIPAATLDFPFDTTRAIVSLLFGGTFLRCPDIKFIFSHAGGTVPFLAERIARLEARPDFKAQVPNGVVSELRRHFYDTALSANEFSFSALLQLVTTDKIVFGTDYPFAPEATMKATIAGLAKHDFSPQERAAIERENALSLLPHLVR